MSAASTSTHALLSTSFSDEPASMTPSAPSVAPTTVEAKRRRYSAEMFKYTEKQAKEAHQDVARRFSLSSNISMSSTSSAGVSPTDTAFHA